MSIPQNFPDRPINSYLPAILKENKSGWIIEYYVEHPETNELTRKQIRLTKIVKRYSSVKDARAHVAKMILALNTKLSGGWNPFFSSEDARLYEKFTNVLDFFLKEKRKESRENTVRSYVSFCKIIVEYVSEIKMNETLFSTFGRVDAVRYMDYMYNTRNVGAYTYNNHIKMARAVWNWAKEKCYTKENPFDYIKPKQKPRKTRVIIPQQTRHKIAEDFTKHCPEMVLVCNLVYSSLIRPNEIKKIRIKDIHTDKHYIVINGENAKNHKTRYATITHEIVDLLNAIKTERYKPNDYLFSDNMQPGATEISYGAFSKRWESMRKRTGVPMEMQLYSLRDTGIYDMLKAGINDLSVMQHADHSSLEMTTIYGNHYDEQLHDIIYNQSPKF